MPITVTAGRKRRSYRSHIRQAHLSQTRARILEALFEELQDLDAISLPRVAARARVSAPTIYRHFANGAQLTRAAAEYFQEKISIRDGPRDLARLIGFMPALFEHFDRHQKVLRARVLLNALRDFRSALPVRASGWIKGMVRRDLPKLSPADATRVAALFRVLSSAHAWEIMRDHFGLSSRQGAESVAWAMQVLRRELARQLRLPAP